MQCDRCGETMQPETVIQLRRSFGRVRARQYQGAYCVNCRVSTPPATAERTTPPRIAAGCRRLTAVVRPGWPHPLRNRHHTPQQDPAWAVGSMESSLPHPG